MNEHHNAQPAGLDDLFSRYWGSTATRIEIMIYNLADQLASDYHGGSWYTGEFVIYNKAFPLRLLQGYTSLIYTAPGTQTSGNVDPYTFSLAVNMAVASHASFILFERNDIEGCRKATEYYHALRDYLAQNEDELPLDHKAFFNLTD